MTTDIEAEWRTARLAHRMQMEKATSTLRDLAAWHGPLTQGETTLLLAALDPLSRLLQHWSGRADASLVQYKEKQPLHGEKKEIEDGS